MNLRVLAVGTAFVSAAVAVACHRAPPPPPPAPPAPLSDSATAALGWANTNVSPFNASDSVASPNERAALAALAEGTRIVGLSELTEGTHEFPMAVRRALFSLAESSHLRALAIQAPMAEAMELDRYVRTGVGEPQRIMRTFGSWRWETREMRALVEAMRAWNRGKPSDEQIGFYGFEIPSSEHAVSVINALPDSIVGAALKAWITKQYSCVAVNEGANFGLEGRAADSAYWNACGPATASVVDSITALHRRLPATSSAATKVAFAELMAKVVDHYMHVGLKHLPRQEQIAEHVLFLADLVGADSKLLMWGGDAEVGRITLDKKIVQTGVALGERLGAKYRPIVFAFGDGIVRTRPIASRMGQPGGLANVRVLAPSADSYEDVLTRVNRSGFWLDMRGLPDGPGGAWLRGPHSMRIITETYSSAAPELFTTQVEFPKNFDAVVFVRHTTAASQ